MLGGPRLTERFGQVILPAVLARTWGAAALAELGRFDDAHRWADEGLRIAGLTGYPVDLTFGLFGSGLTWLRRGEPERAVPLLERALAICRELHMPTYARFVARPLGTAHVMLGRGSDAVGIVAEAVQQDLAMGVWPYHALTLATLGDAHRAVGQLEEAGVWATRALDLARARNEPGHQAHALRVLGDVEIARGEASVRIAEGHYRDARRLAEGQGMRPLVADCHLGLGRLLRRAGDCAQAVEHLAAAAAMYREMGMASRLAEAEAALGEPATAP